MPEEVVDALEGSVSALLSVTLGDEALSSWQGANMTSRRRVLAAVEGSGTDCRALRQTRGGGYQRMAMKKSVAIFAAAPPPASRALAGGCPTPLSSERGEGDAQTVLN